jgi:Predicted hydrolases or acyltransferases (alpha/beta hydrolase superfamily)
MSQWTEGSVLANGLRLHYYRTGGAKPALVLLHGFTDDGLCWTPVARALEEEYDIVMIDARGHGLSDPPTGHNDFTTDLLVADAWAVIDHLQLNQPILMGHSMGAYTAATVAHAHPREISMLVLEDPPWREQHDDGQLEERVQQLAAWGEDMRAKQTRPRAEIIAQCSKENPRWSRAEIEPWATAQQRFNTIVFSSGAAEAGIAWTHMAGPLTMPTLLITGDNSLGAIVTPEIAAQALTTMQDGTLAHIEGTGHCIRRDKFEPYMHIVRKFLMNKAQ